MNQFIPLSIPNFEGNEKKYVDEALDLGWVSTGGAFITRLEKDLASFLHTEEVAACQSGTAALHLSLVEAGIRPGDAVLVPPLTFIAAVNPVKYQFATPIFIDCDDSFCMDPVKLRAFCEQECLFDGSVLSWHGKPVRAVIVVHVFGNMADMVSKTLPKRSAPAIPKVRLRGAVPVRSAISEHSVLTGIKSLPPEAGERSQHKRRRRSDTFASFPHRRRRILIIISMMKSAITTV